MTQTPSPLEGDRLDLRLVDDEGDEEEGMSAEEADAFLSTPIQPADDDEEA